MGGDAAADAVAAAPGEIDRLVLLGSGAYGEPEKWKVRKLFIVARDDANDAGLRLPKIRAQYEKAPDPKELIVVDGDSTDKTLAAGRRRDRADGHGGARMEKNRPQRVARRPRHRFRFDQPTRHLPQHGWVGILVSPCGAL